MTGLTHIDLFSGIGGFALAAQWAGFKTELFCEIDPFCQKVLRKHWPDVPIMEDIKKLDGTKYTGATLLTGGFPCQPFSVAGKRRGKEDDRYLWPEMLRIISEARPTWVLGENVTGIIRMELDSVLSDLEGIEYDTQTFVIPACSIGAIHRRDRIWLLAHSTSNRLEGKLYESGDWKRRAFETFSPQEICNNEKQLPESYVVGSIKRIPDGVDRIRALGNAIVPQVAYQIIRAIKETM